VANPRRRAGNANVLRSRSSTGAIALGCLAIACVGSQAYAQLMRPEPAAKRHSTSEKTVMRGTLLSADGEVLAETTPSYELRLDDRRSPMSYAFYADLAAATGLGMVEFDRPRNNGEFVRRWNVELSSERTRQVEAVKKRWKADGLSLERRETRRYPAGRDAISAVGYFNPEIEIDGNPFLIGAERSADAMLSQEGVRPGRGKSVTLTLDTQLQQEAMRVITQAVERHKATGGAVIVMDLYTGDLLALASAPVFNPYSRDPQERSGYNYAYTNPYEPGSIMKPITEALALESGQVGENWSYLCDGAMTVSGHSIRCTHVHGHVGLNQAMEVSCNGAAMTWGATVGHERMSRFFEESELLKRPGLGLGGESIGVIQVDDAKRLQLATWSIGQSVQLTPIRMASLYSILANDGLYTPPNIIAKVDGMPYQRPAPRSVIEAKAARRAFQSMIGVIESDNGTGKHLRLNGVPLAGKTGTAQKTVNGVTRGSKNYVANFAGVVPADNPRAVIVVVVDDPKDGQYYGGQVSGPVFREMAQAVMRMPQRRTIPGPSLEVEAERLPARPSGTMTP